jgi:FkbM family methyltransferase
MFEKFPLGGRLARKCVSVPYYVFHTWVRRNDARAALAMWFLKDGDDTLLLDHELSADSLVLDVGGYLGVFSDKVIAKYDPHLFVCEPVLGFVADLSEKYRLNRKVRVCPYGLADVTREAQIAVLGESSSLFRPAPQTERIHLMDVAEFLDNVLGRRPVDLMSINIEGGEFALLERMLDLDLLSRVTDLQVQFHPCVPGAIPRRDAILARLTSTHVPTFCYPFVWEGFRLQARRGVVHRSENLAGGLKR